MARHDNPLQYAPTGEPYLGSRIRELRQKKGWRLEEMARSISYHPGSLSKVENNAARPSNRMLQRIAELLEVPLEELMRASLHPAAVGQESVREIPPPRAQPLARPTALSPEATFALAPPSLAPAPSSPAPRAPQPPQEKSRDVPAFLRRRFGFPGGGGGASPNAGSLEPQPARGKVMEDRPPLAARTARDPTSSLSEVAARVEVAQQGLSRVAMELGEARRTLERLLSRQEAAEQSLAEVAAHLREIRARLAEQT